MSGSAQNHSTDIVDSPEATLVARLRSGEDAAFEELVRNYGPSMMAVIQRYLPVHQDAQDALQDAFISAFKAVDRFQAESSLGTWLHKIAVNSALMRIRSQKRRLERPIEDFLPKFLPDGHRENPLDGWAIARCTTNDPETKELVRHCIAQLPESYRVILMLRDIEERTAEEVAELLELSGSNVKTRLHRARQALRELLDKHLS